VARHRRYYLVVPGERIGHAVKKPFTTVWATHSGHGSKIPGTGTYGTRRRGLTEVALHHRPERRVRHARVAVSLAGQQPGQSVPRGSAA
jgi:hypothetical protein